MCTAIALAWSGLPTEMMGRHDLRRRAYRRGGEREVQFWHDDVDPRLPVRRDGRVQLVRWGNWRGRSRFLPRTGWTWLGSVKDGTWRNVETRVVEIPAALGHDRGIWYPIRQGVRGLLVPDERGLAVVYMLIEPASHYYQVMTRNDRMPVLIGERI